MQWKVIPTLFALLNLCARSHMKTSFEVYLIKYQGRNQIFKKTERKKFFDALDELK